jgi:pantoate--beta-alanine ligase
MRVIETVEGIREARGKEHDPVGLVPTLGYLHEGHLSLVRLARKENSLVVVSIFVNPTQFGPGEDLASYPRDTARDLHLLEEEGTGLVFMPGVEEMYPQGFSTWVDVEHITERLEGGSRPGHFRGVATVVAKLFNIVQPDRAYFGQKDAQQALVIKKMAAELNMKLEIVLGKTVRESDGLAMSSRNSYLNPQERQAATVLYKALSLAKQLWQDGETSSTALRREMRLLIEQEPLAQIDYVSIADASSLEELNTLDRPALALLAVRIGKTRLIDNMPLG